MQSFLDFRGRERRDRIEYGLIAAGIAIAIITPVNGVGSKLSANFVKVSMSLK